MDVREAAVGDRVTVDDCRRLVGGPDAAAADEPAGLALTRLACLLVAAEGATRRSQEKNAEG